ncbi:uncharacterized protein LOC114716936 [Neltuma alba]|uniref:uncharacterized protein LOC114716936 n=1 Tax=Neltuma alba TaxID=207710 RepID=UPI0010A50EF1|nr:uncharacterized protein LOC114716936 [Prosopis alba]XP_028757847.1 uncharacterized protein LOC114716936 [Prosopis alba]
MMHCKVKDESGTCTFVIFDREFSRLVGCSAAAMQDRVLYESLSFGVDPCDTLPVGIVEKIMGHKHLFKVRVFHEFVMGRSATCSVMRLTKNSDIIKLHLDTIDGDMGLQLGAENLNLKDNEIQASLMGSNEKSARDISDNT